MALLQPLYNMYGLLVQPLTIPVHPLYSNATVRDGPDTQTLVLIASPTDAHLTQTAFNKRQLARAIRTNGKKDKNMLQLNNAQKTVTTGKALTHVQTLAQTLETNKDVGIVAKFKAIVRQSLHPQALKFAASQAGKGIYYTESVKVSTIAVSRDVLERVSDGKLTIDGLDKASVKTALADDLETQIFVFVVSDASVVVHANGERKTVKFDLSDVQAKATNLPAQTRVVHYSSQVTRGIGQVVRSLAIASGIAKKPAVKPVQLNKTNVNPDLSNVPRDELARALRASGYAVVPPAPKGAPDYAGEIAND
jgi:hypothetical protein